jgi:hypothetical protein
LTKGRKHTHPRGCPAIEKGERESNGQGESISIEGKDRCLIDTNLQQMRPRSSNEKVHNLREHLQPTETYNPKNSNTMCKKEIKKTLKPSIILCFITYTHMSNRLMRSHEYKEM